MRRAVARGRVFPQSFSTDRRYGRLSLKAIGLFHLMWVNADDQGRLCGDPEEIKYSCCPNIDHIAKSDIPGILRELIDNELILHYATSKTYAIQILDWWDPHRAPQWAWPSDYPAPDGWQDHLRYKSNSHTVETLNWPVSGERSGEHPNGSQVSTDITSGERSGEHPEKPLSFPQTPILTPGKGTGKGTGKGGGRGNSPEDSGENHPSPSPRASPSESEIFDRLKSCFSTGWGHIENLADYVQDPRPEKITPRRAGGKETAQLRDLATEISSAGGCPLEWIDDAFKEAAGVQKFHISYVRGVILDWMGVERIRSP